MPLTAKASPSPAMRAQPVSVDAALPTSHALTMPTAGSLPNHSLLQSPPPLTVFVIEFEPTP